MYPRRLPPSEILEPTERPEAEDTDDAVDTERSSIGIAPSGRDGVDQGSGDEARSGGEKVVESMVGGFRRGVEVERYGAVTKKFFPLRAALTVDVYRLKFCQCFGG